MDFKLGSDPELMLQCKDTDKLKSCIPVIPAGKGGGIDIGNGNSVIHDNVLVEFNTRPAMNSDEFVRTIKDSLVGINKIVSAHNLKMLAQASSDYPDEELDHPEARVFGCEPDYDAYRLRDNKIDDEAPYLPFRSAGGHLHIGIPDVEGPLTEILLDNWGKVRVVKALDLFCCVPSMLVDKDNTAKARRKLYGGAGSHRPKDYGVEYRALSNWWVSSPLHTELVYSLTKDALSAILEDKDTDLFDEIGEDRVVSCINDFKIDDAQDIVDSFLNDCLSDKSKELLEKCKEVQLKSINEEWGL